MLDFITKSVSKLFGSKSERDIKDLQPIVSKIHAASKNIVSKSNDELRAMTTAFKQRIAEHIKEELRQMADIRKKIDTENPTIEIQEKLYAEIDAMEKQVDKKIQEILDELLPEAFAVIKETAKR